MPPFVTDASTPIFSFEDLPFGGADIVLAAAGWGQWQQLETSVRNGETRLAEMQSRDETVELGPSVVAFRRARRLAAAEDYRRWLEARGLTRTDVDEHLLRALLGEHELALDDTGAGGRNAPPASTVRAEAVLSGALRRWSERLAGCAASARALAGAPDEADAPDAAEVSSLLAAASGCHSTGIAVSELRDRAPSIAALLAAEEAFKRRVITTQRIERCLADHRLDWQQVSWEELSLESEGAANEVGLLVREDAFELEEAARLAHVPVRTRTGYCDEVPEVAATLTAATPGELVGPLREGGSWKLVIVRARTSPSMDDETLRARASDELLADALERHLAGRVKWHVEL